MSFETAMKHLEKIVAELESGEIGLEAALRKFEEGVEISRFLQKKLDEVQKRVSILVENQKGEIKERPFGEPGADDPEIETSHAP